MRRQLATVAASCLLVSSAPLAAASARACQPLVTDQRGDARVVVNAESLDIVSADLATTSATLRAVVRVVSMEQVVVQSPGGILISLSWRVPGAKRAVYLQGKRSPLGDTFNFGYRSGFQLVPVGRATGRFDSRTDSVTIEVPAKQLAQLARHEKGMRLSGVRALSEALLSTPGEPDLTMSVDDAATPRSHVVGSRSCT